MIFVPVFSADAGPAHPAPRFRAVEPPLFTAVKSSRTTLAVAGGVAIGVGVGVGGGGSGDLTSSKLSTTISLEAAPAIISEYPSITVPAATVPPIVKLLRFTAYV